MTQLSRTICQSLLPVLTKETGMLHGVICIPNQVFKGDRMVEVSPGRFLPATVVTRDIRFDEKTGQKIRRDFMAIQYPEVEARKRPWLGTMFLSVDELGAVGEWYSWIFKTGILFDIGIGAKNIRSGVWSNRSKAWNTENPDDPNNPATNPNNRPNIGNGTEDWGNEFPPDDYPSDTLKGNTLRWDFNISKARLTKCSYFDCNWLEVFYESLEYYKYAKDIPISIELISKDIAFKVGFMYNTAEPAEATVPSCIRFLCTSQPTQNNYLFIFNVKCKENNYKVEVHCNIVNDN